MKSIHSLILIVCISFVVLVCQTQKVHSGWGPSPTHDWITGVPYGLPGTGFDDDKFLDKRKELFERNETNRQKIRVREIKKHDQDSQEEQDLNQEDSGDDLKTLAIIFAIACGIFMFIMSRTSISGPRR